MADRRPDLRRVCARIAIVTLCLAATAVSAQTSRPPVLDSRMVPQVKEQPVRFEENRGQADPRVRYVSRARDYTVALTDGEALLLVRRPTSSARRSRLQASDLALVRMRLAGASPTPHITARDPLPGKVYYAGTGARGPLTPIDTFARVEYSGVYPGIDLVYYGDDHHLEFDFVVAPFADPNQIGLSLDGADGMTLTDTGDLSLRAGGAEVRLEKPLVYQDRDGGRVEIAGAYVLDHTHTVRLRLGSYDPSLPLVIDPTWMTVFGSTNEDLLSGFAVDSAGQPRLLGTTFDPATFPFTDLEAGVFPPPNCFLTKLDAATGLNIYTILFANTLNCETLALSPNDVAYFTGFVYPNGFPNNQGTTVTAVDDSSGVPAVSRFVVGNYDSSVVGEGVDALAVNSLGHVFLLGPCRLVGPGQPPLELSGYNETLDPAQDFFAQGCTPPNGGFISVHQPLLTVVDTSGTFLYGSFLSPGEVITKYGLAADDGDRAYIVGAQSSAVSPTADAYRTVCPAAGTRGFDHCGYLMVLDTTTVGPSSLVYASYLWNTENAETVAVRLGPTGEVYVASEGLVFDDFPSNRPTNPSSWPYSLYPALRDGIQLARFNPDASGMPNQVEFAAVFDPSRAVAALAGETVRDELADLRLFPSGAPAVASIAYAQSLAPLGVVSTFSPSGDRTGAVWTQNLGTRSPAGFGVATGSGGSLFLAGQVDRVGAQDSDIFVERIDAVDPGANQAPTVSIQDPIGGGVTTVFADSPSGVTLQLNAIATDPEGDPLTYSWSGPFTNSPVVTNDFIVARLPVGVQQTITVTVDDGHGNVVSASRTFDVIGTPFVGRTATPIDSTLNGLVFNYAPVTITATGIGSGAGSAYLRSRLDQNPPIPPNLQAGSPPIYFDVSTDAALVSPVAVCVDTRGMSFASPGNIRLYQYQQSGPLAAWADITSAGYPQGNQLCGQSDTLGTFAIFYPQVPSTAVQTIAGNGVLAGSSDGPGGNPIDDYMDGPATSTALNYLYGGAYDRANNHLFVSAGDYILRLNLNDDTIARVAGNGIGMPGSIDGPGGDPRDDLVEGGDAFSTYVGFPAELAVSPTGDLVFFDRNTCRIRRLDLTQGRLFAVAGNGTCGFSGDGFSAGLASISVGMMTFDAAGHLFLADNTYVRVRRIDALTNIIDTVVGDGAYGIPTNGAPALSTIAAPMGLAFDSQGHLLVAAGLHLLRISTGTADALVDGDADEIISVIGGCNTNCQVPFNGDGLPISHPQVYLPGMGHLTVAQDGAVIFRDYFRIRRIAPGGDGIVTGASDEIISTIGGYFDWATASQITNFNGDTRSTQSLFSPAPFVVDDDQARIIVVDGNNYRVRRFGQPPPSVNPGDADLTISATGSPDPVNTNASLRYDISIANNGPATATDVRMTYVIPAGAVFESAASTNAITCSTPAVGTSGTVTCEFETLASGAVSAVEIAITTQTAGSLSSTFTITAAEADSNGGNNSTTVSTTVNLSAAVINVTEVVVVADTVGVLPSAMIGVTEQIVVDDAPILLPSAMIGIVEQIAVSDAPGLLPSAMIGVIEQIVVADQPGVAPQESPALVMTLAPVTTEAAVGESVIWTAFVSDSSDEETRVVLRAASNEPRVQFAHPGVANSPLSVTVSGLDIAVSLGTNASGALSSTAAHVTQAINASPANGALVVAATWPGYAGTGIVQPRALAPLSIVYITVGSPPVLLPCFTNVPGWCSQTHGLPQPGTEAVVAFLDVNGNGTRDAAEPFATGEATWVDRTPPTLTLPGNIGAVATDAAGASVSFVATAFDSIDGSIAPSCTPASGATFPIGTTTVTCTAVDRSANTASGSFNVTVGTSAGAVLQLASMAVFTRDATGQYVGSITVRNAGIADARAVQVTTAILNTTSAISLPVQFGDVQPGSRVTRQVRFPGSAGNAGAGNNLRLTFRWTGGSVSIAQRVVLPAATAPLWGWVDLHTHPMSNLAFGGKLFHGAADIGSLLPAVQMPYDPQCRYDVRAISIDEALSDDAPTHGDPFQSKCGNVTRNALVQALEAFNHAVRQPGHAVGSPTFVNWPRWNDITHQKMWVDWIRRAKEGGLRVMVALSHNNRTLAELMGSGGPISGVKNDKASSDLQINEIKAFVARHPDLMKVALTAAELYQIVQDGKIAVVLGVEVDNIGDFNDQTSLTTAMVEAEIDRLYGQGVRYIFPVHLTDNVFGDTAIYSALFNLATRRETGNFWSVGCAARADEVGFRSFNFPPELNLFIPPGVGSPPQAPHCLTDGGTFFLGHVNARSANGITPLGEFALKTMMKRGMIIDVDHLSDRGVETALQLAEAVQPGGGYPLVSGHGAIRDRNRFNAENSRTRAQLQRIGCLQGMFGLGGDGAEAYPWASQYMDAFTEMGKPTALCPDKSSLGRGRVAFGTDTNSLVSGPRPTLMDVKPGTLPRFSDIYNSASPANDNPLLPSLGRSTTGTRTWDYNFDGVAHYGMYADFVKDLRTAPVSASLAITGKDLVDNHLLRSADYFFRMWEKIESQKTNVR